jgi:hypothetical protein
MHAHTVTTVFLTVQDAELWKLVQSARAVPTETCHDIDGCPTEQINVVLLRCITAHRKLNSAVLWSCSYTVVLKQCTESKQHRATFC